MCCTLPTEAFPYSSPTTAISLDSPPPQEKEKEAIVEDLNQKAVVVVIHPCTIALLLLLCRRQLSSVASHLSCIARLLVQHLFAAQPNKTVEKSNVLGRLQGSRGRGGT